MMYLKIANPVPGNDPIHAWHIGELPPRIYASGVVEVQADSDELIEVIHSCVSLPCVTDPNHKHYQVQRWFGDHAKWIAANIVGCK